MSIGAVPLGAVPLSQFSCLCRLHDRMPVLLPTQEAQDAWLSAEMPVDGM